MKDIGIILGIRPDVIRASKILNLLSNTSDISFDFIWSGQHYSENMKDVFFEQLNVPKPDVEFEIEKGNDAQIVSSVIKNTYNHLEKNKYKAVVFSRRYQYCNGFNSSCTTQYSYCSYRRMYEIIRLENA